MTPHPLEELARWHDNRASEYNRLGTVSGRSQADQHTAFGSILRAAIPNCECGELVSRELAMDGPYRSISFTRRDAGTDAERVLIYGTDAKRIPFIEEPTKTLSAAVAAARANGAEGTT